MVTYCVTESDGIIIFEKDVTDGLPCDLVEYDEEDTTVDSATADVTRSGMLGVMSIDVDWKMEVGREEEG